MDAGLRTQRPGSRDALPSTASSIKHTRVTSLCFALLLLQCLPSVQAIHHMQRRAPRRLVPRQSHDSTPLHITIMCLEDIYPGINTQSGNGPTDTGFRLSPGEARELTVSENWQGRVWGRTNCSFNEDGTKPSNGSPGKACGSGDCNGVLACIVGGDTPVTLAEFTLDAGDGQSYYDISLVDGYNLPMAIVVEPHGDVSLDDLPPNLTNPACAGTAGLLAPADWMPYADGQTFLKTNSSFPLPLDSKVDDQQVLNWCPWDLQVNMPKPPDDGRYTYPDHSVQRQAFNPCYSACAKWNLAQDCCTGDHNSPSTCQPAEYSRNAKRVCPDAYSFAFDDQTSTFIIPSGGGFGVIFRPGGRSSNILTAESHNVSSASGGQVSFGGGGSGKNVDKVAARDCYDKPKIHRAGTCKPSSYDEDGKEDGTLRLGELRKRDEYDWSGVDASDEPIAGVRVLELVKRGLHLRDWEGERRRELEARQSAPGLVRSLLRMRSTATAVAAPGEVKSTTWYLMGAGLTVTAVVFMML